MSIEIRGKTDRTMKAVAKALTTYAAAHPRAEIDIYRQNSVSVRIRVVDPDFAGVSRSDRHDAVWNYLEGLPEDQLS
jgi:stress-induced morphogen